MPSSSKKQHNFMAAIANNPAFAKKVGIPQRVGKDFDDADKGKKFGSGGRTRPDVQKVNKPKTDHGKSAFFNKGGDTMAKMNAGMMAIMAKKKAGAKAEMPMKKGGMAGGGMPMKDGKPAFIGDGKGMKHGGMKKMNMGGMAGGGSASKRADGVATKGKTKGTMVGMKSGGKAC
jgi:hypothetical protein